MAVAEQTFVQRSYYDGSVTRECCTELPDSASGAREDDVLALTFSQSMVIRYANKLVLSSASTVMLHHVVRPLLDALDAHDVKVEWACYFRKNITSPWTQHHSTSDVMAQEYADLKAAFPTGVSLLTGPIDGEHFFHFVYDGIDRTEHAARVEQDVQLNVFMFGVSTNMPSNQPGETCLSDKAAQPQKDYQKITLLSHHGEYELLRFFADERNACFDTNAADAIASPARMQQLICQFKPARFTVVGLQDRDTSPVHLRRNFGAFSGYHLQNCTVNYFTHDYAYHQWIYVRKE